MLGGLKFGKKKETKKRKAETEGRDDEAPKSKYESSGGGFKLPKGGLYDPKAPKQVRNADNLAALRDLKGGLSGPLTSTTSSSSSAAVPSDSKTEYVLNLPQRPDITTADTRASDKRRGALKKKDHQQQFSKFATSDKSLQDLIDEEKNALSMDEIYARNVNRVGSRYKGGEFGSAKGEGNGFDEEDQTDMTIFTDKKERVTEVERWEREKQKQITEQKKLKAVESRCWWWINSSNFNKTLLLSLGEHTCLVKTPENLSVVRGMCYIVPIHHKASFVEADGEVWDEVTRFKTSLTAMWAKQGREVVFCETVLQSSGSGLYQTKIECIPVKKGSDFPLSFNMGIREQIGDEATHGKVIKIKGKKGGARFAVPRGFSYFAVDWREGGADDGYAMMIEDERAFNKDFATDTVAGVMQVERVKFNRKKGNAEEDRMGVIEFLDYWKEFDWTDELDAD